MQPDGTVNSDNGGGNNSKDPNRRRQILENELTRVNGQLEVSHKVRQGTAPLMTEILNCNQFVLLCAEDQ